jgi:hypothetical protein
VRGVAAGVVLVTGFTPRAQADTPSTEAAADARRHEAKTRFDEGVTAFREHRWADAVQSFRQADAIAPSAALSFNIAKAYEHLDDVPGALRWYRDYLRRSPQAPNAGEVQARVTTLAATLAERGVQQLTVLSTPSGAAVSIDERQVGTAPLTLELAPGRHRLRLELPGYQEQQSELVLDARIPQDLSQRLEPLGTSGSATTTSSAPAGPARPAERPYGIAPWIVMGAGAASLAGALGFELARRSAETSAKSEPQLEYPQHYDSMESRQTTARVLLGLGGALIVTGGVLMVLNTPKQPASSLAVGCGPGSCGLVWRRGFE